MITRGTYLYPVITEQYAIQIAREWNIPASGSGYVTRSKVPSVILISSKCKMQGGEIHDELWIPAGNCRQPITENIIYAEPTYFFNSAVNAFGCL